MSAVRRSDRRANRNNLSSPYARPAKSANVRPSKKSLWSLSGLINLLNPFGGSSEPEESDTSGPSDGEIEQGSPPRRFSPPQQPLPPSPLPPQQQLSPNSSWPSVMNGPNTTSSPAARQSNHPFTLNTHSPAHSGPSLAKNLEPVTRFLVEKAGQPLNEFEAAGIVDYIQKNVQGSSFPPGKPEPFRFSVSPSRSTSPNVQSASNSQTSRKSLSKNPNGIYRWQGAGSSRPRNRYQSPGFAPRPQQHRIKLSPPKTPPTTDTKRRRVGDEAEFSISQKPVVPSTSVTGLQSPMPESSILPLHHAIEPSALSLNGKPATSSIFALVPPATPKPNGIQPRIRTAGLATKPTTPAVPSPLRQTWKESDSPPQASPPSRPTRAADFMTGLIKEVTPTKKPDISNPYQTASPVKPPAPVRKPVAKRPRPSAKLAEKSKEPEPEVSAQAIIEATVPRGIKRSRPPMEVEKLTRREETSDNENFAFVLNGSDRSIHFATETLFAGGEENPPKRCKTPPAGRTSIVEAADDASALKVVVWPAEVIEPDDDVVHINGKLAPSPPATTPSLPSVTKPLSGITKTSAPKEPSKLRYSIQADKVEVKSTDSVTTPPLPSFFTSSPTPPGVAKTTAIPTKARLSPKEEALAMDVDELPKYAFSIGTSSSFAAGPSFSATRIAVLSLDAASLPVYEFNPVVAPASTMNGFNWTAAGMKAPTTSAQKWKCSLCSLENPADAKEKCTVCDTPRQAPTDSPSAPTPAPISSTPVMTAQLCTPLKGFDWSAAGIKPPTKPENGTWTCSVCSLNNSASAVEKCSVCEAPR